MLEREPLVRADGARDGRPISSRWWLAGSMLVGCTLLGGWFFAARERPDDEAQACPNLRELAGKWSFTTEVTGSRALDKLDMQGFYSLLVEVDGCVARAQLEKSGFSGHAFTERRTQRAEATLAPGSGAFAFGHEGTFELRDASGRGPDQHFVFSVDAGRLVGVWRQRGARWAKSGLYGVLEGAAADEPAPQQLQLATLPCAVRCTIACDTLRRDGEQIVHAQETCKAACAATGANTVACGDRRPLPDTLHLAMAGPEETVDAHCGRHECQLDPRLGKRRAPAIVPKEIGDLRPEAHLLAIASDPPTLRLALRTPAGWFASDPLLTTGDDAELVSAQLYERSLGSGADRRLVLGSLATSSDRAPHTLACRPDPSEPRCIMVTPDFEPSPGAKADHVLPLGEDTLAVTSENDVLLFSW